MDIIITFILIVFIFGLLVGIHELGHFIAAKKCGVWVQEFAFGFGPTLYHKKSKGTIYRINLFPLGGYVKLFGEQKLAKDEKFLRKFEKLDDKKEDHIKALAQKYKLEKIADELRLLDKVNGLKEISEKDKHLLLDYELNQGYRVIDEKRYSNKSIAQRAFIISAGVIMNLLLGIFIYSIYLIIVNFHVVLFNMAPSNFYGANVKEVNSPFFIDEQNMENPEIEYFNAPIIKANGEFITDLAKFVAELKNQTTSTSDIEYYKNGFIEKGTIDKEILFGRVPELQENLDYSGKLAIGKVIENTAAAKAGIKGNIVIVELAKIVIDKYETFLDVLEKNQSKELEIKYYDLDTKKLVVQNIVLGDKSKNELIFGATDFYEYYPFGYLPSYYIDYSDNKFVAGLLHSLNITKYQYEVFKSILKYSFETKDTSLLSESVGGPIKIGNEIGNLVKLGNFTDILNLTGLISLSLGVMNLLPIPIVDGGHLLFLLIEKIKGSPLSDKIQGVFNMIGLVFLIFLSLVITLKDIWSLLFI